MTADERFMRAALALAARAQGRTRPNPMVGAVVVSPRGTIVGRGYHPRAGQPHAEMLALRRAGRRARGATLYVTLEPCRHVGRTPPCVPAVVSAGVRRVVVAMEDPNPAMRGRSVRTLRQAGVATRVGVLRAEAERVNPIYLTWRRRGRPFITVKVAQSLDGKIATRTGQSRWISGPAARRYAHQLRASADAMLVGVNTILADNPRLTARGVGTLHPLVRVIVDSMLRTPPTARVLRGGGPVWIATTAAAPAARRRALIARGAELLILPRRARGVDLRALGRRLAQREITHLLVEGGGELIASLLRDGLIDRWVAMIAPTLIGGRTAPTPVGGAGIASLRRATSIQVTASRRLGHDFVIEGTVQR